MRHRAREAHGGGARRDLRDARGLVRVARAEPAHARVELDVHGPAAASRDGLDEALVPRDDIRAGRKRDVELVRRQRAHDEDRPLDPPSRSARASSAAATASQLAPPACAARAAGNAPCP